MSIINTIKGWFRGMFSGKAKEVFEVDSIVSSKIDTFVNRCVQIYKGTPDWLDAANGIKTINFAQTICEETARLATLAISIKVDGSSKAEWLQRILDRYYYNFRTWVEYGLAYGMLVLKPAGEEIEMLTSNRYIITDVSGDNVTGAVFIYTEQVGQKWYTRLEYHRFVGSDYLIDNKCFKGSAENDMNEAVGIELTPWADLAESMAVQGLTKPLFAVFRTPNANNIDLNASVGLPIFARAVEELKDLDVAYSRNSEEIEDSRRVVLMDSDRLFPFGAGMAEVMRVNPAKGNELRKNSMGLPKYVKMVDGNTDGSEFYHEINPTLQTSTRQEGINNLLSLIGFKCGFSNGYFVLDEKTGMVTATQVESDDRRTIQFIKDVRDKLQACLDGLIYALDVSATLYGIAPAGVYEVSYNFGDITYNYEEDKQTWWKYVQNNMVPAWVYFVKFEGMTEEEAKAMVAEAAPKESSLFPE